MRRRAVRCAGEVLAGEGEGGVLEHGVGRSWRRTGRVEVLGCDGPTRSGSSPAASSTERANSYHETAPWLVTWNRLVRRPTTRRWTALARSSAKGCPIWSSTNASRPVPARRRTVVPLCSRRGTAHPRGPDDRGVAVQLVLAAQLGVAVHRLRGWGIPLVVGRSSCRRRRSRSTRMDPSAHRSGGLHHEPGPSADEEGRRGPPRRHDRPSAAAWTTASGWIVGRLLHLVAVGHVEHGWSAAVTSWPANTSISSRPTWPPAGDQNVHAVTVRSSAAPTTTGCPGTR